MASLTSDIMERKGSLFLRSNHMNYSRATLNSNWHQAREAETKDYDISKASNRNLNKASYHRIGNVTDGTLPMTTYQTSSAQISTLKREYTAQDPHKCMINEDTAAEVNLDRETGAPIEGYGSVLPRHKKDYNKAHFDTTHRADYKLPYPNEERAKAIDTSVDHTSAYKRCQSQFTDTADYRRIGRNTWQDESGVYHNSHLKPQAPPYQPTNTIRAAFE